MKKAVMNLAAAVGFVTSVAACGGGAKGTVNDYLSQANCADRASFILNPDANKAALVDYYRAKNINACITKHESIDDSDCANTKQGEYCVVRVPKVASYDVKRTAEGFKVDWRSSQGYTPVTLAAVVAMKRLGQKAQPTLVRAEAKLTDPTDGNVSVYLSASEASTILAFAPKDSPVAKGLATALLDGKEHKLMLVLTQGTDAALEIKEVVQTGWHQRDDELK